MRLYNVGNRIVNTYVYETAAGYIMIDTGYEASLASVERKLKQHQIKLSDLNYLFLTHAHDDHAGFLNELLEKIPHLKVMMSAKARPTLKRGQHSFEGGCSGYLAWFFCKAMGLAGKAKHVFPIIEDKYDQRLIEITEANKVELEEILEGEILFTPGHTSDSISLKLGQKIFCGDAAMNGLPSLNRITIWLENKEQFQQSWDLMLAQKADDIYPAHGKPFKISDFVKYKDKIAKVKLLKL